MWTHQKAAMPANSAKVLQSVACVAQAVFVDEPHRVALSTHVGDALSVGGPVICQQIVAHLEGKCDLGVDETGQ